MGNRPLLKLVGLLRSMEYATVDGRELALSALQPKIGQAAFESPSVFNYYLADFEPPGRLGAASFVQDKKKIRHRRHRAACCQLSWFHSLHQHVRRRKRNRLGGHSKTA